MSETIKTVLLFLTLNSSLFMIQAQQKPSLLLTNHTFTENRVEVGGIVLNDKPVKDATLTGENAKAFEIKKSRLFFTSTNNTEGEYNITISVKSMGSIVSDTFRIVNDRFIRNKVIAHRGAWKNTGATENSITALKRALQLRCGGTEFDVHMSADSVLVINHDSHIQSILIEKTDAKDLLNLKLANGENLPTLESFLREGISQHTSKLILEIKPSAISNERGIATARQVVKLVKTFRAQAWIDYISFDYDICKEVLRIDPYARVAYLNGDKDPQDLKEDNMWGFDYHFKVLKKNKKWISKAKNLGLTTNAWTVNDNETMEWLLKEDIDFITTNEPELLLEILKK